jgi:hypothetical protein
MVRDKRKGQVGKRYQGEFLTSQIAPGIFFLRCAAGTHALSVPGTIFTVLCLI